MALSITMSITAWFIVVLIFLGSLFLVYGFNQIFPSSTQKKTKSKKKIRANTIGICPICSSPLKEGEQLKSAVFPGKTDSICHIFGCPHCYPFADKNIKKICPVCKRILFADSYLIARMFSRPDAKNHVHIIGCTECRKIKP